jgi:hypothetical protein
MQCAFFPQICKYPCCLKSQKYKIWYPAVGFVEESIGPRFIHVSATVWQLQPLYKSYLKELKIKGMSDYT